MRTKNELFGEVKRRNLDDGDANFPWEDELPTGGLLDYVAVQLLFDNVVQFDTCGVLEDVTNFFLFPGQDQMPVNEVTENIVDTESYVMYRESNGGNRILEEGTVGSLKECTDDETQRFTAKALEFMTCSNFNFLGVIMNFGEIQSITGTIVNCINSVFYTSAGRVCSKGDRLDDFRDSCIKGFLDNSVVGELVRQVLTKPGLTCDCAGHLNDVPNCALPNVAGGFVDGVLIKRMGCALQEQFCPYLENNCGGRIAALNECLPLYEDLSRDGYGTSEECFNVLCACEKIDTGDFNFPGELMGLPLADMCIEQSNIKYPDDKINQRFEKFQEVCASVITPDVETIPIQTTPKPTNSPTNIEQTISMIQSNTGAGISAGTFISGVLVGCAFLAICAILVVAIIAVSRHYGARRYRDDASYDEDSDYDDEDED